MKVSVMFPRLLLLHRASCWAWTHPSSMRLMGRRSLSSSTGFGMVTVASSGKSAESDRVEPTLFTLRQLLGGDFAGFTAEYDPSNGRVKKVPAYLVPESMIEWGQHPTSLELIVSEDLFSLDNEPAQFELNRSCLTVLPETGCAVDNLGVQKSFEIGWNLLHVSEACVGLVRTVSPTVRILETIFGLPDENDSNMIHRLRVSVTIAESQSRLEKVHMAWERRFDTSSSRGSRADGGGLDGASVSRWMGPHLFQNGPKRLETPTKESESVSLNGTTLRLPANISLMLDVEGEEAQLQVFHADRRKIKYEWFKDAVESIQAMSF